MQVVILIILVVGLLLNKRDYGLKTNKYNILIFSILPINLRKNEYKIILSWNKESIYFS